MNLIKDVKSFASSFENAWKKLFKDAPPAIKIVQGVLTVLGPVAVGLTTEFAGLPAGALASVVLNEIKTDMANALAATNSINATTSVPQLLTSIQGNLPALLSAIKVENPALVSKVETAVNLITPEIDALIAAF